MSIFEFDDQQGVRTRGTLHAPGATPGDVLTVGTPHGAVSPSPGGGSQPPTVLAPVKAVALYAAEISTNPPTGALTVDGYAVQDGDRILAANGNVGAGGVSGDILGVWIANTTGDWTRADDFADGATIADGTVIPVATSNGSFMYGSLWTVEGLVVGSGSGVIAVLTGETVITANPQPGDFPQIFLGTGQVGTQGDASFSTSGKLGFYGTAPIVQPTGVAVDAAAIHAALVALGLITA